MKYLKKEVRNVLHFLYADKHRSFYKLVLSFLMEKVRHFQNTKNIQEIRLQTIPMLFFVLNIFLSLPLFLFRSTLKAGSIRWLSSCHGRNFVTHLRHVPA